MRDPKRIERILTLLQEAWSKYPDLRLTQLVINTSDSKGSYPSVFYMEDDVFEDKLKKLLNSHLQVGSE